MIPPVSLAAVSTTIVRIIIPLVAGIGAAIGSFIALMKLIPERTAIVVGYQGEIIDDLMGEIRRQAQLIADLESRVKEMEDRPPRYLS